MHRVWETSRALSKRSTTAPLLGTAWDYLILTASHAAQASAYEAQLVQRRRLGLLGDVKQTLVVADPGGRRIGSGGSTLAALIEILRIELPPERQADPTAWLEVLGGLRVLIVHAGGDSRRLPAYGPCGKAFIPLPVASDSALATTLFDRQLPTYLKLPPMPPQRGQVVIASGDVLLEFQSDTVRFAAEGFTGLGYRAQPELASGHGVYCCGADRVVRRFLQKPTCAEQAAAGALDAEGRAVLDIGLINFDAHSAVELLETCGLTVNEAETWSSPLAAEVLELGLDFYREVCCAWGEGSDFETYRTQVRACGSRLSDSLLERLFERLSHARCKVQVLPACRFLHFGTTRQIISSGRELVRSNEPATSGGLPILINCAQSASASVTGPRSWLEACQIDAAVQLQGDNVLVGVDVDRPLTLPLGACLDVLAGKSRRQRPVYFVRMLDQSDDFHRTPAAAVRLCNWPLVDWLAAAGTTADEFWDKALPHSERSAWNARLFPAVSRADGYYDWLWMFDPQRATADQLQAWLAADRYSLAEIAQRTDQQAFHERRQTLRAAAVAASWPQMFAPNSGFSAADLAQVLISSPQPAAILSGVLEHAQQQSEPNLVRGPEYAFVLSRVLHSLGSALALYAIDHLATAERHWTAAIEQLAPEARLWLGELTSAGEVPNAANEAAAWLQAAAFAALTARIAASAAEVVPAPKSALRSDELVWGRAPARLDLAGGWTDTPPFSLEHGGCVLNAAVELNTQAPIQAYARLIAEPLIRMRSIDVGSDVEIRSFDELLDYRHARGEFSLVKAALVESGFAPAAAADPQAATLRDVLMQFGGGLEISTVAAIPKGSGLGTSSIMGAVVLAVIARVLGRELSPTELFHAVLRLEQALTTGGGWQDQIGGCIGELKLISTDPGLVPDASLRFVPADVLDPVLNGGQTLLYYTGITRLAKNILQQVVGRYLDRDRTTLATLATLPLLAEASAAAISAKDLPAFGSLVDAAWQANKRLDPKSSSDEIESLLARCRPHVYGAKLLGAGGGGFLLLVCKSPAAASELRQSLEADPPNSRARMFDYTVTRQGLTVSVC